MRDIIAPVRPIKDVKEFNLLVELNRLVKMRKTKSKRKITAMKKQLEDPKPADSPPQLQVETDAEKKKLIESLMKELDDHYRDNRLSHLLHPSTGSREDYIRTHLYRYWKGKRYTADKIEDTLRAIDPSVSEEIVARTTKAFDSASGDLYVA